MSKGRYDETFPGEDAPSHDPLKTLKLKTLASDCVIKKDVTTMPLLIYYDELYMAHPLISALILET